LGQEKGVIWKRDAAERYKKKGAIFPRKKKKKEVEKRGRTEDQIISSRRTGRSHMTNSRGL